VRSIARIYDKFIGSLELEISISIDILELHENMFLNTTQKREGYISYNRVRKFGINWH
jgi:hypothetical protein